MHTIFVLLSNNNYRIEIESKYNYSTYKNCTNAAVKYHLRV